jgi:hypothetical protein
VETGSVAPCEIRVRQCSGSSERGDERLVVLGIDENACLWGHELRRAPDLSRDDRSRRGHGLERRQAERLDEARLAQDVARCDPGGNRIVANAAREADPVASLESLTKRAVAHERQRSLAAPLERARESKDVLALRERTQA